MDHAPRDAGAALVRPGPAIGLVRIRLSEGALVQLLFPIGRDATGGSWHGLVQRVMSRGCQLRTVPELLGSVIPEPVLIRLEALDYGMARRSRVLAGVLRWR